VDYLDKLTEAEKAWLNKFNGEFVNASFAEGNKKNLHKSRSQKKACYNSNNARNRCILTRQQAQGQFDYLDDIKDHTDEYYEDDINTTLDLLNEGYLDRDGQRTRKI
jgi:hypothetical protein